MTVDICALFGYSTFPKPHLNDSYFLMYGGSSLISFSLFMLSFTQPNHFYQVGCTILSVIPYLDLIYQIFLTQGLGAGIGTGLLYIPSMAIVSHYFVKRRALAMTIVVSGSSLGAVIHPIMLNKTLEGYLGFKNAVRASAGLVTGLLLIACLLMRTRLPPPKQKTDLGKMLKKFSHDGAFIAATLG